MRAVDPFPRRRWRNPDEPRAVRLLEEATQFPPCRVKPGSNRSGQDRMHARLRNVDLPPKILSGEAQEADGGYVALSPWRANHFHAATPKPALRASSARCAANRSASATAANVGLAWPEEGNTELEDT